MACFTIRASTEQSQRTAEPGKEYECSDPVRNQLPASCSQGQQEKLSHVLSQWREGHKRSFSPDPPKMKRTLWMSKHLSLHLNLAISTARPANITVQAFFLGQDLPALLITLYDTAAGEDFETAHSYALELVRCHARVMQDYCHDEFVVLPVTLAHSELCLEHIKAKYNEEVFKASAYYSGQAELTDKVYDSLKKGMAAVSAGTLMPFFLYHGTSEQTWTLQLDWQWRQLLHNFLDHMADDQKHDPPPFPTEPFHRVLVSFLEAVKRLSHTEEIYVNTVDQTIKDCLRRSAEHSESEHGVRERWNFSAPVEDGISIELSPSSVKFQRARKAATRESSTKTDRTPLHDAADAGHETEVLRLLTAGAEVNVPDSEGRTPLHCASRRGYGEVAKVLLENGADPTIACTTHRWRALHEAAIAGKFEVVRQLLSKGIAVDCADKNGWTALHYASDEGYDEVVELLLKHDAEVNRETSLGWAALNFASSRGHGKVVQLLLNAGADPNFSSPRSRMGCTALHFAADAGHEAVVEQLLVHGAALDCTDKREMTALAFAKRKKHDAVVRLLQQNGAGSGPEKGWTALHYASDTANCGRVKELLLKGAAVDCIDSQGRTALHYASAKGDYNVAELLLDNGADPNAQDKHRWTPLHFAASENHEDIGILLLRRDVELKKHTTEGWTALHLAYLKGHEDFAELLLDSGANINAADATEWTGLQTAAKFLNMEQLLANEANVEAETDTGLTANDIAQQKGAKKDFLKLIKKPKKTMKNSRRRKPSSGSGQRGSNVFLVI